MRFGKITQHYPANHHQPLMNIGDIVQTLAIERLYQLMGISEEQVVGVSKYSLASYDGEELVMPITGFFNERPDMGEIPFAPAIRPVFLGYHLGWGLYDAANLEFFRRHQPIGCRDSHTRRAFEANGLAAYVCGCPTILFARRVRQASRRKVFLVDIPAELEAFIPAELLADAERISHILPVQSNPLSTQEYHGLVAHTRQLLDRYRDEARLVITGRIHCAVPCMAMGIPVVFAVGDMRDSYDFLAHMTPIYTRESFAMIDWNPPVAELEQIKDEFLELARTSLRQAYALGTSGSHLDRFYYNPEVDNGYRSELVKLEALFTEADAEYILWGVGALGSKVQQLMRQHFPRARLHACCDTFAERDFFGQPVLRPEQLPPASTGIKVLAATSYGVTESEQTLEALGYRKGIDYESMLVLPGMKR